ncbi:hypothetical protein OG226_45085 [Streptomyces sp. NBC_01261]|nr:MULTISPECIES: hypothetical protein [unclassified Streptomyces]
MTNDADHGHRITAAWTVREIGIRYRRGRPHAYRFTTDLQADQHGRA